MSRKVSAAFLAALASLASPDAVRAEADPAKDPVAGRIRDSFKVDGIALFDPHAQHAPRMGICAQSVFAGLKWCVSGAAEETSGNASYVKTTGYNINADNRIVYAISSKRGYPLRREEFDGIVQAIGERYGAGATVLTFRKPSEDGTGVDSLIAVWGGIRLVQLTAAEYAQVESGGSLRRGHLVDHRFNLVASAKAREPVFKVEGEAGFILHLMSTSPDRADVIARAVYPPVFLPPPAKPGAEPASPLVGETVRRATSAAPAEPPGNGGAAAEERRKRIEAERGLAAERLLREEAERRAAGEKAAREEAERKAAAEKKRLEDELKAARERAERPLAEERARQLEEQRKALEERRRRDEAEKKAAEERAKRAEAERAEAERKAQDERRRKDEAERKAAAEEKARAEAERRAAVERMEAEERRRRQDAERAGRDRPLAEERPPDDRRAAEQRRAQEESERAAEESRRAGEEQSAVERRAEADRLARERAQRPDSWRQRAARAAKEAGAIWSLAETQDRVADERVMRSQTIFADGQNGDKGRLAIEVTFECAISGRDRRLSAHARGFDRNSGVRVAFRADGEGSFGVRTRFMLDDHVPQSGLLFRERQEDTASILEIPMAAGNLSSNAPRGAIWLRHYSVIVEFPLVNGTVTAAIAPHADNIRRVLEACAQ